MGLRAKWKPVLKMKGKVPDELVEEFKKDVETVKNKTKKYRYE